MWAPLLDSYLFSDQTQYLCGACNAAFDKSSKVVFHHQHCPIISRIAASSSTPGDYSSRIQHSSIISVKNKTASTSVSGLVSRLSNNTNKDSIVQDDFVKDDVYDKVAKAKATNSIPKPSVVTATATSSSASKVVSGKGEDKCLGGEGSGFRMPDNFDLPDEIIQGQFPAARFTSTPIRYAISEEDKARGKAVPSYVEQGPPRGEKTEKAAAPEPSQKKATSEEAEVKRPAKRIENIPQHKHKALNAKGLSVVEALAEKRKRLMLKIRGDEGLKDEVKKKSLKRPLKDNVLSPTKRPAPNFIKKARLEEKKRHPREQGETSSSNEVSASSSEDERSKKSYKKDYDAKNDDSEEEQLPSKDKTVYSPRKTSKMLSNTKKLSVRVCHNGDDRILELYQYRSKLKREARSAALAASSTDSEDTESDIKKPMKLEKVGKRIKRIISEDSSGDEADDKQCKAEIKVETNVGDKYSDNSMKIDATPKCKPNIKIEILNKIEKPESRPQEISTKVVDPFSPSPSVSALPTPPPTASKPISAISKLPRM